MEALIPDQQFRKRGAQFAGQKGHGGKGRFTAEDFNYDKKRTGIFVPGKRRWNIKGMRAMRRKWGRKSDGKGRHIAHR